MSHTPGPWRAFGHAVVDEQDVTVAITNHAPRPYPECRENARLIAAAPELLAALREAEDLFSIDFTYTDGRVLDSPLDSAGTAWVKQARAAIAKAGGEP